MIFYFTGTGNSLYAAKQLGNDLVSIPQLMKQDSLEFTADSIGIVAPVYGHEVPPMVKEFLHKAVFRTEYFYMVLTYGNRHGGAAELAKNLCAECEISVNYINVLLMADNWLPSFDMNEQKKLDKNVDSQIAAIRSDISARRNYISAVTDEDRTAHRGFTERMKQMPPDVWQNLIKVAGQCVGCGICEKLCPSGSIRVVGGKAEHIPGSCQTCLACAHACPQKAIGLTIPEVNSEARYRNEHITLNEIIAANHQD